MQWKYEYMTVWLLWKVGDGGYCAGWKSSNIYQCVSKYLDVFATSMLCVVWPCLGFISHYDHLTYNTICLTDETLICIAIKCPWKLLSLWNTIISFSMGQKNSLVYFSFSCNSILKNDISSFVIHGLNSQCTYFLLSSHTLSYIRSRE
jgi:hypothetical protein